MQQQCGALRQRKLIQEKQKLGFLLAPEEQIDRTGLEIGGRVGNFIAPSGCAILLSPQLDAFLVCNAK